MVVVRVLWVLAIRPLLRGQRDQGRDALTVRWNLVNQVAPVLGVNGCDPLRLVRGQVVPAQPPALRLGGGVDLRGDLALVEVPAPAGGDAFQGAGVVLGGPHLAWPRPEPRRGEGGEPLGKLRPFPPAVGLNAALPVLGQHRRERVAVTGVVNGGGQQLLEG